MDRLSETAGILKSGIYAARGMQLAADDLRCLDPQFKARVPGTMINVVSALLQRVSEMDGTGDFAVFSTWLSPLLSKKVQQGTFYGTIKGHIDDAGEKEMLLAKARWLFPLYWAAARHWLLGWVDLTASEIHIFDSMPELQSYMWAELAIVEVAETVFTTLGRPDMNLEPWPVIKHSPSELHRQMDGHSCGFFLIGGIRVIGNGQDLSSITQDGMLRVRRDTINCCRLLAPKPIAPTKVAAETTPDAEDPMGSTATQVAEDVAMTPVEAALDAENPIVSTATSVAEEGLPLISDFEAINSSKRKLEDSHIQDSKPSKPVKIPKTAKGKSKTKDQRKEILESDPDTSVVEPHRVFCTKCSAYVKLDKKREFKLENWIQHQERCPGITGQVVIRVAVKKKHVATPSVANFFDPGPLRNPSPEPVIIPIPKSCKHLSGGVYVEYIQRTMTRSLGGVSAVLRARLARQVLLYKKFGPLKGQNTPESIQQVEHSIPAKGNDCLSSPDWTATEHAKLDAALKGWARWEVNFGAGTVRSTRCEGLTTNPDAVCDACRKVSKDESLMHAVKKANNEAALPLEQQYEVQKTRQKFSNRRLQDYEARKLDSLLKDPITFKALKTLEKGETTECFLQLYEGALNGKLKEYETVRELCAVVAETIERKDAKTLSGIRYPPHYLNFAILMRSYGGNSARQFGILSGEIPLPSMRHMRALIPKSADAMTNPYLIYENMARVKRLADSIRYSGPVAVAGDCTKVRKRLSYSNDFGGHILGSVWELADCIAEDPEDIERVINEITKAKAEASQVRAILIKIPLPQIPPQVVALIPTNGTDDASKIFEQHLKLLAMAAELSLPVVSFAADGAASELAAQRLMDAHKTTLPPVTYDYPLYGIHLSAPVLPTGPVVSGQDPGHAKKTGRNGVQSGNRTEDLGEDVVVNNTLVELQKTPNSGLLPSDVNGKLDKQDDGPARHLFHAQALHACTTGEGETAKIREGFTGLFVYLFVLGKYHNIFCILFDAWLNRTMTVANRVLAVLRARFFLHFWRAHIIRMSVEYPDLHSVARSFITTPSFHIFNRLCDSLLLLVIIYARRYPNQPFCPWLHGTEFVEHFFGLARMMLPNFTWAEFIKLVQHVMVRQKILLSGSFKERRERNARLGYVLDFDASVLTAEDRRLAEVTLSDRDMNGLVELAFTEASLICTQLLHIRAPKPTENKPLSLAPLGAPTPKVKPSDGEASDSDAEDDGDYDDGQDLELEAELLRSSDISDEARDIALATHDAARYSAFCDDYEKAVEELDSLPATPVVVLGPEPPPVGASAAENSAPLPVLFQSELIDESGKLSIAMMLQARLHWQAGTTTKSEKVSQIDSKYALSRIARAVGAQKDDTNPEKMSLQEAANLTRVLQDQNATIQESKPVKYREIRWKGFAGVVQRLVNADVLPNIIAKNVHQLNPLSVGHMTIMWNGTRFYIGQILDVYKKGANSRHGSIPSPISISGLSFISLRAYLPLGTVGSSSSLPQQCIDWFWIPDVDEDLEDSGECEVAPLFSCHHKNLPLRIHTHAKVDHLLFNLGPDIFEKAGPGVRHRSLKDHAARCWISLTQPAVSTEVKKLTVKVPKPSKR
ncbi:hypothetical protein B0H16DRAFT_1807499 [Mycena metata]|uniref:Ubiquitin-like protease family profile domain-containing protein n=1 Tax=Mycena metata TaxID=1033252 RepID=A0AAD7H9D4_9AGAR|nr:hypothetical protein B0H16DRAFT_1807499 [Mycena metata]